MFPTFEEREFPKALREEYARANVKSDSLLLQHAPNDEMRLIFSQRAAILAPGYQKVQARPRIGVLAVQLPGGCNANCDGCYTDVMNYFASILDMRFEKLKKHISRLTKAGLKILKVIGKGEPILYPHLIELIDFCHSLGVHVIIFTNGLTNDSTGECIPPGLKDRVAWGWCFLYVKYWGPKDLQIKMVQPKQGFHYDDYVDSLPRLVAVLKEVSPNHVGVQIMISSINEEIMIPEAKRLIGVMSCLIEPFNEEGDGKRHPEMKPSQEFPWTIGCDKPNRGLYQLNLDAHGMVMPGTFLSELAVPIGEDIIDDLWGRIWILNRYFFDFRYNVGPCACKKLLQKMAASH